MLSRRRWDLAYMVLGHVETPCVGDVTVAGGYGNAFCRRRDTVVGSVSSSTVIFKWWWLEGRRWMGEGWVVGREAEGGGTFTSVVFRQPLSGRSVG